MELMTSWERKGREEERLALVKRQLARQVGVLSPAIEKQLNRLSGERLGELAEALLDFDKVEDLQHWLAAGRKSATLG